MVSIKGAVYNNVFRIIALVIISNNFQEILRCSQFEVRGQATSLHLPIQS